MFSLPIHWTIFPSTINMPLLPHANYMYEKSHVLCPLYGGFVMLVGNIISIFSFLCYDEHSYYSFFFFLNSYCFIQKKCFLFKLIWTIIISSYAYVNRWLSQVKLEWIKITSFCCSYRDSFSLIIIDLSSSLLLLLFLWFMDSLLPQ